MEASRGAGAQIVTANWLTGCGFDSHPEEMKYLFIFIFFRSGVRAKSGVEFRHLTRNTSSAESEERSVLTLGFLCLRCYVWDTA